MAPKKGVMGLDAFARMNFLYQASAFCSSFSSKNSQNLSAYYGHVFKNIAKKSVLRAEPEIKRTFCKGCSTLLVAGENARVKLHKKRDASLVWMCLRCHTVKRFGVRKVYKMWIENEEALVETKTFKRPSGTDPLSENYKKEDVEKVSVEPTPKSSALEETNIH